MISLLAALVPLLPILAMTIIGVGYLNSHYRGEKAERSTARIAIGASGLSLLIILVIDVYSMVSGAPGQLQLGQWFSSGSITVDINFTLDTFGLAMATLVAALSLLITMFSIHYLHREAGFQRFFLILSLFNSAMLLIVMAGNAVLTFVGWELAGVSSYLLIAYAYERSNATTNASHAFVTNRIGDAGFILGIALLYYHLGTTEWNTDATGMDTLIPDLAAFGFVLAALAKSAQLPFSAWIYRALEGPTPSSTLFYGAVMVHAGVYLLIRLEPLLTQAPAVMSLLIILGGLTAVYGYITGFVQTNIKSSLMAATTTQTGLMFLECGLGWFELAAWHLVAHALWRAYQFLHAPAVMHLMNRPARPAPFWLTRSRKLYTAALQRFWLDNIVHWLAVRPTQSLSHDLQDFDEQVVNRFIGLPVQASAISTVAHWEAHKQGHSLIESDVGRGRGILGRTMEWLASLLYWFEEHLILHSGSGSQLDRLKNTGKYLEKIEQLLSQPRYLLLIVLITFMVIL
jgi:NADH:ubiquinone oxidoreductase subunit 5 (subunit L)/multisubunit Na+/H+ antiporter MnhA subunit